MTKLVNIIILLFAIGLIASFQSTNAAGKTIDFESKQRKSQQRIISLGGDITEIVYALNAQQQLIAVDITSYWPEEAKLLPQVGYYRAISAEGILSLSPDLLLMTDEAGPSSTIEQLKSVNIPMEIISADKTPEGIIKKIQRIATAIKLPEQGKKLIDQVKTDFKKLEDLKAQKHNRPRVAFFLSLAKCNNLSAGTQTP